MLIRPASAAEMATVGTFAADAGVVPVTPDQLRAELGAGRYRPEWTWIAEDGGRIVARALWWGRDDGDGPLTLDSLDVGADVRDRSGLAAELLRRAHAELGRRPEYQLTLDPAASPRCRALWSGARRLRGPPG